MITRKCNYRCRGCNIWQEQDQYELSAQEIKRGLDVLKNLGIVEIVFSGGDPLLRDDAQEIIEYASRSFVTTVYDNGSMAAKKIDALRNVDFVAISIDSLDEAKNDYIKGVKGAWRKAMDAVETLKKRRDKCGCYADDIADEPARDIGHHQLLFREGNPTLVLLVLL